MKKINVKIDDYVRGHMQSPRGRGGWLFLFDDAATVTGAVNFNGTYTEAKRQAVQYAREHGKHTVRVQP